MDKKKIFAIILFFIMAMFMFSYADAPIKTELQDNKEEEVKKPEEPVVKPIVNNTIKAPIIRVVAPAKDFAPIIKIDKDPLKVVFGTGYDLNEGVSVIDDKDTLTIASVTPAKEELVLGENVVTYTSTKDRAFQSASKSRTVIVLDPNADEDGDGYSNLEEFNENTDYDNENEYPDYDKAPTITLDESNVYEMLVYDAIPTFKATAYDVADGVVPVTITHDINKDIVANTYKVTFRAVDSLGNVKEIIRDFAVVDTTKPILSLIGLDYIKVILGINPYTDEKATATDNYDADKLVEGVLNGDPTILGEYKLEYNHSDLSGNKADEIIRTIKVLAPGDDEDGDGYTNLEEYNEDTDYDDPLDFPDYDKAPTITLDENNIYSIEVYTDIPEFKATATDVADGIVPVTITHNINPLISGNYKIIFRAVDSLGNAKVLEKDFVVQKRKLEVTIEDKTSIFSNALEPLTYTITTGVEVTPEAGISLSKEDGLNVGIYTISGTHTNSEYEVIFVDGKYTITAKTLTEEDLGTEFAFNNKTVVYNKTEHSIEVTGLPSGFTVTYDDNKLTTAGSKLVTATIKGDANYSGTITKTANLTVTPALITYKIDNQTSVYKAALADLTGSITSGEVYGSDDLKIVLSTTATPTSNIGEYSITGTFTNTNYNVTFVNGTYTITAKNINDVDLSGITFADLSTGYDKTAKTIVIGGTLPDGLVVNYTDNTRTNAGEQTAKATISGANYSGTVEKTALLKINQANIKFTAEDKTSVYGQPLKELTFKTAGTNYGNEIVPTLIKADGLNVGEYVIKITAVNANYNITLVNGKYIITKKTLEESDLGSAKFNDGEFTYNGEERSIVVEGLTGSGLTATYDDNTRKDVGSQTVTATISGPNYEGSLTRKAELKITERLITYKIGSKESIYKSPLVGLTGSIISGEVVSGDNLGVDLSTTATTTSNVGEYPITGTFTNTNYNVTFVPGTYTIKQKPIAESDVTDILFTNKTVTYNGSEHSIEVTNLPTDFSVSYSNNTRTIHGSQTATATITGNGNYSGTVTKTATLTVEKANYDMSEVKFNDKEVTYDGSAHEITITGTLPSGVTVSYENNIHTNAGTYPATAKFTSDNDNYTLISNMTANLIINKADPGVSPVTGLTAVKGKMLYSVELPSGYAYKNADSELTIAGYNTVPVIFTPTDTVNYNTVETTATIYVKNIFTVIFKNDDAVLKTESVIEGSSATAPEDDPTKEGHTFNGWDVEFTKVQSDLVVSAKWNVKQYTISFNTNGGSSVSAIIQNYGTTITHPANPTKTGYTFAGWDQEIPTTMPANNVIINANWTINKYTITFNTDGGNIIDPITLDYGTTITPPANPTKPNYTFVKWEPLIPSTMPANNLTVKAIWKANQIGIRAEIADNVQLLFTQNHNYDIKNYLEVYALYADGTEVLVTDYTTNFTTANIGVNITLTINHNGFVANNLKYTIIADIAYQTKFELKMPTSGNNGYYRTTYSNCTQNCDVAPNITWVSKTTPIFELIEHYVENISISEVKVLYEGENNYVKTTVSNTVRWSRKTSSGWTSMIVWDPVRIVDFAEGKTIDKVEVTYHRAGVGSYKIIFKYNTSTNEFKAISEVPHNNK